MMISEDEIILLKNRVQKSQNKKGYILKLKNGKTYIGNSVIELLKKVENQREIKYILTNETNFLEIELEYIKKNTTKDFEIYVLKDNEIIEYKI